MAEAFRSRWDAAFLVGYALFQLPGGWAGDRYGAKNVLTIAILMWSLFTALTGLAPDLAVGHWLGAITAFMIVRFMVGAGEAANSTNAAKIVANWMGLEHRGIGSSFTILGIGIGGAITPPLIAWVMIHFRWRSSFYLSGLLGLFVVLLWEGYVTNTPEEHTSVNPEELALIRSGRQSKPKPPGISTRPPWGKMLSSSSVWGLVLGYFCQGYPIYFFHTWLSHLFLPYMVFHLPDPRPSLEHRRRGLLGGGTLPRDCRACSVRWMVFGFGGVQNRKKSWAENFRLCGMFASGLLLWLGSATSSSTDAILLLAAAAGFNMFATSTFWATCIDLTQEFTGSLSGLMNTFGNLGGWLSPILTAYLATHLSWDRALDCASIISILSGALFLFVKADRSLDTKVLAAAEESAGKRAVPAL